MTVPAVMSGISESKNKEKNINHENGLILMVDDDPTRELVEQDLWS